MKEISLNDTVYNLVKQYPEIREIIISLGFETIAQRQDAEYRRPNHDHREGSQTQRRAGGGIRRNARKKTASA